MKITLIRPTYGSRFQVQPPLSLGYLSSALKMNGYTNIDLIDGSYYQMSPSKALEVLKKKGVPDIVGIQIYTGSHNWAKEFIQLLKKELPQVVTVVGGPHITALRFLAMDYIQPDYGVMGEGEKPVVEFTRFIEGKISDPSDVTGLIFKKNGEWTHAKEQFGFFSDANEIPFPDWELLEPEKYFDYMEGATMPLRGKRPAPILTSRGCPYLCTFCSSGLTNKRIMRYRSPRNIVDEIKYLIKNYGVNEIFFTDDNLTMDLKRAEEIFDLLLNENVKIAWRAPNGLRIDRLSEPLISKMSKSGAYYVGVGIETGNEQVMKRIKKHVNLDIVKGTLALLHKYKIQVSGFFMCGLREETLDEMKDSIKFALSVPFDRIQVSNYIPYPGSEDFDFVFNKDNPEEYRKNVMEFQKNETVPAFQPLGFDKVIEMQKKFIKKFYFRPSVMLSMIFRFNFSQLKAIFRHPWIRRWFQKDVDWYDK